MNSENIEEHVIKETRESFSLKVEKLVWEKDIGYLDAVQELAEKQNIEVEGIKSLISKDLMSKLSAEAEELKLLKTVENRLNI